MRSKKLVLVLILITVVSALAGCATNSPNGSGPGTNTTGAPQVTKENAKSVLADAMANMNDTDRIAVDTSFTASGQNGKFVFATDKGNNIFVLTATELPAGAPGIGTVTPSNAFTLYRKGETVVLYDSRNATVLVNEPGKAGGTGFGADAFTPGDNPIGAPMLPGDPLGGIFASFQNKDAITLKTVEPTTHKGRPAVKLVADFAAAEGTSSGSIIIFTETLLPARMELDTPDGEGGNTHFRGDFLYGDEVMPFLVVKSAVTRAAALAANKDTTADQIVLTFRGASGAAIPLEEIEVRLTPGSSFPGSAGSATSPEPDPCDDAGASQGGADCAPTNETAPGTNGTAPESTTTDPAFIVKFLASEGSATGRGVTVTFHDVDGDGKVTAGDRVVADFSNSSMQPYDASLELFDTVTGTRVTPPLTGFLLLAGLAVAAMLARRT